MYEWFSTWVRFPLTSLTFVRGLSVDEVMARFVPVGPMTSMTVRGADGLDHPSVLIDELNDGWLVAIERRSVMMGESDNWLEEMSAAGEAVSLVILDASTCFYRAVGGHLTAGIDLVVPGFRYGDEPQWLDPYLAEVEPLIWRHDVEPYDEGPDCNLPAAAARILELGCGIHLHESMLTKSLPCREIRDPYT